MKRLREVLVDQYIGAIAIGVLLAQTVAGAITGLVQTSMTYYFARSESRSALGSSSVFPWNTLTFLLVAVSLELLAAFLLMKWLYAPAQGDQDSGSAPAESVEP